jgi:hypothetical protein
LPILLTVNPDLGHAPCAISIGLTVCPTEALPYYLYLIARSFRIDFGNVDLIVRFLKYQGPRAEDDYECNDSRENLPPTSSPRVFPTDSGSSSSSDSATNRRLRRVGVGG